MRNDAAASGPSWLGRIAFFAGLLALWQGLAWLRVFEPWTFPSPVSVAQRLAHGVSDGRVERAVLVTLRRLALGYAASVVLGAALGIALHRVKALAGTVGLLVVGLQALPSVCWLPVALLWFGLSEAAIVFVVVMGALLSITVATEQGLRGVPPLYVRAARAMGAEGLRLYTKVRLPAALPSVLTGMKLGWAFAWRSLMAAELLYASGGLGQLLVMGRDFNDMAEVVAVMAVIVAIGIAFDRLVFSRLERGVRERFGLERA